MNRQSNTLESFPPFQSCENTHPRNVDNDFKCENSDCENTEPSFFQCLYCHKKLCDSFVCFQDEMEQDEGASRKIFSVLDDKDYHPWEEFKRETEDGGYCNSCFFKQAGMILQGYKSIYGSQIKCRNCSKERPEVGDLSTDGCGNFYRSKCYDCDPLHQYEVVKSLSIIDALLEHILRHYP